MPKTEAERLMEEAELHRAFAQASMDLEQAEAEALEAGRAAKVARARLLVAEADGEPTDDLVVGVERAVEAHNAVRDPHQAAQEHMATMRAFWREVRAMNGGGIVAVDNDEGGEG